MSNALRRPIPRRPRLRLPAIYAGWWVISAPFLAATLTVGSGQYAFGQFIEPLETQFGWTRTQINLSLSFTAIGSLIAPALGWIMDRRGVRGIMVASMLLIAISYLLRPLMSELWHWYALSLVQYAGYAGASILPAGRLVGIWFAEKRGRVMGITLMGNNFGGFTFPLITTFALAASWQISGVTLPSWAGAYLLFGVIGVALTLYTLLVVREYPTAAQARNRGATNPAAAQTQAGPPTLTGASVGEALRSKAFYATMIAVVLGTFTYSAILPQVFNHLTAESVPIATAGLALSAIAICGMTGKFVMGLLAERITARYALMIDLTGQATFLLLLTHFAPLSSLYLWTFVPSFGFFLGAFGALFPLIIQDAFGIRRYGSIMGIINMATAISFFGGPLLAGRSFDITGGYHFAFMTVAALFYAAALTLTQAKPAKSPQETMDETRRL